MLRNKVSNCGMHKCSYFILLILSYSSVHSLPMGYKNSTMMMGSINDSQITTDVNYALTSSSALGVRLLYVDIDNQSPQLLKEASFTHRLIRANEPNSQSNLWFFGGIGNLASTDSASESTTTYSPGFQLDYETRRIYMSIYNRMLRGKHVNYDVARIKGGFSFYKTGYNRTQPWFIMEISHMNGVKETTQFVPTLRLINKNLYVELGINQKAKPNIGLMYLF